MRIVVAPDSFKGSLSAPEAARAIAAGLRRVLPEAEILLLPMADGGEGTLDAVLAAIGGERRHTRVTGGHGRPLLADWGLLQDGTVFVEVARIVGLYLPGMESTPPEERTTAGIGELLGHCLDQGSTRFMIGLGGSATNDGGAGMLAALGARFTDHRGAPLTATPAGLAKGFCLDLDGLDGRLGHASISFLSDVGNPLLGSRGATAVFGPQKGVAPEAAPLFEGVMESIAATGDHWVGQRLSAAAGTGAAGGLGYAFRLLGASQESGAETLCRLLEMDAALKGADWVITGEGRSDVQTLEGKAPAVVAAHARRRGVPAILVSGGISEESLPSLRRHFDACFSLTTPAVPAGTAMALAAELLARRAEQAASEKITCTSKPFKR